MARKFQSKLPGRDGIAGTDNTNTKLCSAAIYKVLPNNKLDIDGSEAYARFLLNPDSWEDHKISNWAQHNIPGQSDPIMQWVSGGARTLTFEALVTKDTAVFDLTKPVGGLAAAIDGAINVVGNIASSFLGVSVPNIGDLLPIGEQGVGEELGIQNHLNYYRSLMYPLTKNEKTVLAGSPPLCAIFAGTSFSTEMVAEPEIGIDTDLWVITDLKIKITKQLPNLTPMEAIVSFQAIQYIRRTKDAADFSQDPGSQPSQEGSLLDSLVGAVSDLFS